MRRRIAALSFAVSLLFLTSTAFATDRLVPSVYPTIQMGIDAAEPGDTVIVDPNTYTGDDNRDLDFGGKAITVRSTDPNNPAVVAATIIDCEESGRGFYFHNHEDANSILAGFTIINGTAYKGAGIYCEEAGPTITNCIITGNSAYEGGGIHCYESSPTIINCRITGNSAGREGGGIFCYYYSPIITDCTISGNLADFGGGIYCYKSNPTITNCTITSNSAEDYWGGIAIEYGSVKIKENTISYNSIDTHSESAVHIWGRPSDVVEISGNTFIDDGIRLGGYLQNAIISGNIFRDFITGFDKYAIRVGGTSNHANTITVEGNIFSNFLTDGWGHLRVIEISGTGDAVNVGIIKNNTFEKVQGLAVGLGGTGNATIYGDILNNTFKNCEYGIWIGGRSSSKQYGVFKNNTIVNNSVGIEKGSRVNNLKIANCILWDNTDDLVNVSDSEISYSDISDGDYCGTNGNVCLDPLFINPDSNDYRLSSYSPCINAGDPNYIPEPNETDLDGLPRIIGSRIDMGAYEFNHIPVADAGPNQTAYAWLDGFAKVTLDGTASFDDDGQPLTYEWSWFVNDEIVILRGGDGIVNMLDFAVLAKGLSQTENLFADIAPPGGDGVVDILDLSILTEAWLSTPALSNWNPQCDIASTGATLIIELPIGVHTIALIVNDGIEDSQPAYVTITVVEPIESQLWIFPQIINRHSQMKTISALMHLPEGVTEDQVDSNEPLLLYPQGDPDGIEATCQFVFQYYQQGTLRTVIFAFFDKSELMEAVPDDGRVELQVVGMFKTGQYFYGSDTVWIVSWCWGPW